MSLPFVTRVDQGSPDLSSLDGVFSIINPTAQDKGRWLAEFQEPLVFGKEYTLSGRVKTTAARLRVSLVWLANVPGKQIHAVEHAVDLPGPVADYQDFTYQVVVPSGVKMLQIELRGRSGAGLYEFKDIALVETNPEPAPAEEPSMLTLSVIVGKVRWRITASEESITFLRLNHEPFYETSRLYYLD